MYLTQRHRIYPNQLQRESLARQFGCSRLVYNSMLSHIQETNKFIRYESMWYFYSRIIKPQYPFMVNISVQTIQQTLMNLEQAFRNFFKDKLNYKYPRFKSKYSRQSIEYPRYVKVDRDKKLLYLPKLMKNPIKIVLERDLPEYTRVTIVKESNNEYYACFVIEKQEVKHEYDENLTHLGLDVGLNPFLTTSEGEQISNPKYYYKSQENIARKNKSLSKKKIQSRRWKKAKWRLAKTHRKIKNQRNDFLHKLSYKLANNFNIKGVSVESLKIKNMLKNNSLAKSISDSAWNTFITFLHYKLKLRGKVLSYVNPNYPSTQTCSNCKFSIGPKGLNNLKKKEWTCSFCGQNHDRDINAAKNIAFYCDEAYHNSKGFSSVTV